MTRERHAGLRGAYSRRTKPAPQTNEELSRACIRIRLELHYLERDIDRMLRRIERWERKAGA